MCLMVLVCRMTAAGANESYLVHQFNPEGAVPNIYVGAILQDSQGYIWIGTQDGLYRYDGNECRKMELPFGNPGYLIINDLCEDVNDDVWIATVAGLSRYDRDKDEIVSYNELSPSVNVTKIIRFVNRSILVSAREQGVFSIDSDSHECSRIMLDGSDEDYWSSSICRSDDGTVYMLVREKGLYTLRSYDKNVANPLSGQKDNPFRYFPAIDNIECHNGRLITGVADETFIYNLSTGELDIRDWSDINDALKMPDGTLILATNRGLVFTDKNFNVIRHYKESSADPYALSDKSIRTICKDRDGNLWVGTVHGGVQVFHTNSAEIRYYYPKTPASPMKRRLRSIVEDPEGNIWMGSENGGLAMYSPKTDETKHIDLPIRTDNILALKVLGRYLWVGSYSFSDPLLRVDRKTLSVETFPDFSRCAYHIESYSKDTLILSNRNGISFIDLASGRPKEFFMPELKNVRTGSMITAPDSSIWTGGRNAALFNIRNGKVRQIDEFFPEGTENLDLICQAGLTPMMFDSKGNMWVSILNRGVASIDFEHQEIRFYSSFVRSGCSLFFAAVEDKDGDIWITSSDGIVVLSPEKGTYVVFGGNDGLMSGRFREFSLCLASDGIMYAGLYEGMVSFNHETFKKSSCIVPDIVFTEAHIMGYLGDVVSDMDMDRDRIVLRHNENSLLIKVSDMRYSRPRRSVVYYKVDGLKNSSWLPVDNGKIMLAGLSKGTYTLRVRSRLLDGTFCNNEVTRELVIRPPVLVSAPAFVIYFILLLIVIVTVEKITARNSLRVARDSVRRENEKLEMQRQKQYYTSKVEFLMNIAHEIRTPLSLIKGPIDDMIQRYANSSNKDMVRDLHIVSRNSDKLSQLLDELLDFKKINSTGYELHLTDYNVNDLVQMVFDRFRLMAESRNINYRLNLPQEPLSCKVDKIAMDKIISNLLANAMKYSSSDVQLTLEINADEFRIILENDGSVVPLDARERIFKPFERFVDGSIVETGTGIGLYVSRNFAELLNGTLEMDADDTINRFILTLPIIEMDEAEEQPDIPRLPYLDIPQSRRTIFVVEDSEDMREFITRQLSSSYHVVAVSNGVEALDILNKSVNTLPDIIISDVMMPGMDGLQLCREIKKNPATRHITFIMLSALADDTSKLQGLKYGADAYMTKPFSIKELLVVVQNQLSLRDAIIESEGDSPEDREQGTHEHNIKIVKIVDEYVSQHLDEESLNVEKLAEIACVSVSGLFKKMKATIGVSPNEFILISRLKRATDLLRDENLSIEQVSIMVGFRSHAYFSTCFKKQFGVTPKQYREKFNQHKEY